MHGPWYDEAFDEDGTLRPAYVALRQRTGWDPLCPSIAVAEQLRDRPLADDTRIFPVPVVIDDTEYRSVIQAGLAQRARALQRLFADLVLGPRRVLDAGIGLTRDLIEEILAVEGISLARLRDLWRTSGPDAIRFVYGPDLARDPGGRWVVLEDNVGCVGGSADGFFVADRYCAATELPGCPACDRQPDLAIAIRRWLARLGCEPEDGVPAVLGCDAWGDNPYALRHDENARRRLILNTLGIAVIERGQLEQRWADESDRPTAVVNFQVDTSAVWREALGRHGVAMFNAPGTGVLGNKALLPYVDDVIRCYAREEPILPTPPTRLLRDGVLPADKENWVVKTAAGCQGSEVFVLRWQPRQRLELIEDLVRGEWCGAAAVVQRYVEPSRLAPAGPGAWDGYRVEIRPVSYVLDWQEVYVSEQPLGKVVSVYDARGLNNISHGASFVPVLREPCRAAPMSGRIPGSKSNAVAWREVHRR